MSESDQPVFQDQSNFVDLFEDRGFVHIRAMGTGEQELAKLVCSVSKPRGGTFWPAMQTVIYRAGMDPQESVALSSERLNAHTDGSFETSPPSSLFLQCVTPDLPGFGESRVIEVAAILAGLPSNTVKTLFEPIYRFTRGEKGITTQVDAPILTRQPDASVNIRFRHDERYQIVAQTNEGRSAIAALSRFVASPVNQQGVFLDEGDVLWLDNLRCLHARTSLSGKRVRFLRTAWGDTLTHK